MLQLPLQLPPLPPPPLSPVDCPCCRHRAALVSRRWHAAAHAPGLLNEERLYTGSSAMAQLPLFTLAAAARAARAQP